MENRRKTSELAKRAEADVEQMRRATGLDPSRPAGGPLCLGGMISRVPRGVEPSSARRGWRATFSSTGPASAASGRSSTAEHASPAACIAARNARPARKRNASTEPARSTENRQKESSSTGTRKPSAETGASSTAWVIAAPSRRGASYRPPPRRRRTSAASRRTAMRQRQVEIRWSGFWSSGRGCSLTPRSSWALRWSARAAADGAEWSTWLSSTTGARRAGDDRGR